MKGRICVTFATVVPLAVYYWPTLVEQLGGSSYKAALIVMLALACGCTDMNALTGQPEEDHDHEH